MSAVVDETSKPIFIREKPDSTVAFIMNLHFYRCGSRYYAETPNILDLVQAFGAHASRVVACAPTLIVDQPPAGADPILADVVVCELPYYSSNLDLILRSPLLGVRLLRQLWPAMREWDVVGGDAPSGFGLATVILAILRRKQGFFYVRGHLTRCLRGEHRVFTLKGSLIMGAFWPLDVIARALTAAGVVTFAMGPALAERHRGPRVHVLRGYARPAVVDGPPVAPVSDARALRRIAYVGRLSGEKGADVLLRAIALLRDRTHYVHLTITGDGPEMADLRALAHELKIEEYVSFVGNIADPTLVRERFLDAGIVVIPSRTEGVPVSMLEAMALGRVVVATNVGGIPAVLEDRKNGLLVAPENPDAIASAIELLLGEPDLAFRLARNAAVTGRELNIEAQSEVMMREAGFK